jgi:hypothetical protein
VPPATTSAPFRAMTPTAVSNAVNQEAHAVFLQRLWVHFLVHDEQVLARATQGTHTHTYPDNTVNCMGAFPTILFRIVFGGWKG